MGRVKETRPEHQVDSGEVAEQTRPRNLAEAVEDQLVRIDDDNSQLRARVNALETERRVRSAIAALSLAALAFFFGVFVERATASEPDPGQVCSNALAGVVQAVETTWSTASEAVDRAQAAVEDPAVRACMAERLN